MIQEKSPHVCRFDCRFGMMDCLEIASSDLALTGTTPRLLTVTGIVLLLLGLTLSRARKSSRSRVFGSVWLVLVCISLPFVAPERASAQPNCEQPASPVTNVVNGAISEASEASTSQNSPVASQSQPDSTSVISPAVEPTTVDKVDTVPATNASVPVTVEPATTTITAEPATTTVAATTTTAAATTTTAAATTTIEPTTTVEPTTTTTVAATTTAVEPTTSTTVAATSTTSTTTSTTTTTLAPVVLGSWELGMDYFGRGTSAPIGLVVKFGTVIATTTVIDAGDDNLFGTSDDVQTQKFPSPQGKITITAPVGRLVKVQLPSLQVDPPHTDVNNCPTSQTTFTPTLWTWPTPAVNSELIHTMASAGTSQITATNTHTTTISACSGPGGPGGGGAGGGPITN